MATSSKAKKRTVRLASGRKRARQDVKLNAHNSSLRSKFRTVIKNVQKAVAAGDSAKAADLFKSAQKTIDSIAGRALLGVGLVVLAVSFKRATASRAAQ